VPGVLGKAKATFFPHTLGTYVWEWRCNCPHYLLYV